MRCLVAGQDERGPRVGAIPVGSAAALVADRWRVAGPGNRSAEPSARHARPRQWRACRSSGSVVRRAVAATHRILGIGQAVRQGDSCAPTCLQCGAAERKVAVRWRVAGCAPRGRHISAAAVRGAGWGEPRYASGSRASALHVASWRSKVQPLMISSGVFPRMPASVRRLHRRSY